MREKYSENLKQTREKIFSDFKSGLEPENLLKQYSDFMDQLLKQIWNTLKFNHTEMSLIAIGGYGRQELFPYSDVDFIILHPNTSKPDPELVGEFLATLWDIGLEPSHQVLSPETALTLSQENIDFYSSLACRRWLISKPEIRENFEHLFKQQDPYSTVDFLKLKQKELKERYAKFGDTVSQLEPHIKQSPGGLRDIQTLQSVAQKMPGENWISVSEAQNLKESFHFLAKIRFGLQMLAHKREDRLLFQHQIECAGLFDLDVLQFMQDYFQNAHEISVLVRLLLQHFAAAYHTPKNIVPLNARFELIDGWLECKQTNLFESHTESMMEVFYLLCSVECSGIGVNTLRQIRHYRDLFTTNIANQSSCRNWFKQILASPRKVSDTLNQMHDCGILERYLPDFALIVGKMQYDLYHSFTVDSHILRLIARLEQFGNPDELTPELCPQIWSRIPKRELLFIAGLFHDIAKGRGGDHSTLGKDCVIQFCKIHEYSSEDTELVAWLVEQHLLMSLTAQRKDISDWEVISQFATQCQNQARCDHIYLLTVADIQATNPKLWNSWRASLLHRLYIETLHAFDKELLQPQTRQDLISNKQAQALQKLFENNSDVNAIKTLWQHWGAEYFLQNTLEAIVQHSRLLLIQNPLQQPIIECSQHNALGVTEIFVSAARTPTLFAIVASIVDQLDLNIVSASLTTTDLGYSLDNYYVLETNGRPIAEMDRIREIKLLLQSALQKTDLNMSKTRRRSPKTQHHFRQPAQVFIVPHHDQNSLELNVIAQDRPGLLGLIASHLAAKHFNVLMAKINTLGERVEDVFRLTTTDGDQNALCKELAESIDLYLKT